MAANQNPNPQAQQQGQQPQQAQQQQGYACPPPGYYPQQQYAYPPCPPPAAPKEEGIGVWTALGLVGAGFLLGQLFSEPTQPQMPPPPQGLKMPWQK